MKKATSFSHLTIVMILFVWILFILVSEDALANDSVLRLNDKDYFSARGFDVLVFENQYDGMFFDEKKAGILLIHHGVRIATGGAVRLKSTPEQWDQIPRVIERKVNREDNSIDVLLRYEDYEFDSWLHVRPEGDGVRISVTLDKPLPERLQGRTGLNIEFLPSAYFEKTYLMDGRTGIFPLHPSGPMQVMPAETQLRQFGGHSTFYDHGRSEYVEPKPIAAGRTLILAPEDPEHRLRIQSPGELLLLDGRNVAQNGWFVVRTLIPANATGVVAEWLLTPNRIPNWTRPPMIAHSQVGYHPQQAKRAVIELDVNEAPLPTASLLQWNEGGEWIEKFNATVQQWGPYLRYNYAVFDFSAVREEGLYTIRYGEQQTGAFPIGAHVYDNTWQQTLDVWFPVQMDHMTVNEAYRVWHGAAHLDDARQAPVNHQHFDGFRMGANTDTPYQPGDHIPGLNIGGWFDAGDYDLRTGSHCNTVLHLVDAREHFNIDRDETLVDQDGRFVDIHHPDGFPDIVQQIEHGALLLVAHHRAVGHAIDTIIEPQLHQYHHLGDASTITDNLIYNPRLAAAESDGYTSGVPDDRWAFTNRSPWTNYASAAALAAASRALRGYNDDLADECLTTAKKVWLDEHQQPPRESRRGFMFAAGSEMEAALQLYICSKEQPYADRFAELLWPGMERGLNRTMRYAARAVPYMDAAYREKLLPFVRQYKEATDETSGQNPFGVPISAGGWAGNGGVISWAITSYHLHKAYPEIVGPQATYRGLDYIYGCHPGSNISFVSGVGVQSKKVAYGNNRADFSFIAGGVVPGILVLKPDFPENMEDWPFLWGENEYVIDICAEYIFLANAVRDLGER